MNIVNTSAEFYHFEVPAIVTRPTRSKVPICFRVTVSRATAWEVETKP